MEKFFQDYQYTFSALGAIGTFLAVMISLYFSYRAIKSNDSKIKASISINILTVPHTPKYIGVTIRNVGLMSVSIPFSYLNFRLPFSNLAFLINPLDAYSADFNIPQKSYPYKIEPKHSQTFFVSTTDSFFKNGGNLLEKKINYRFLNFIRAEIHISDGSIFKVKLPKSIKKMIKENLQTN
ncbi:MAG: hypothetical protein K0R24_622 [Gammaproteobacteria bacterium]|jgi:hypothetical protein|nr:hypothetical protein [Gammaproteobacteria bacterium]